jgi:hypothetical protein
MRLENFDQRETMRASQLDQATFDDLAARDGQNLISVFIPTHRKGTRDRPGSDQTQERVVRG